MCSAEGRRFPALRIAIVHDYLTQRGGAERVVLALLDAFPGARLVTSVYDPDTTFPEFRRHKVETIFPAWLTVDPRVLFPLLPRAFGAHRVDDVDAVVCSSSGWAHAVSSNAPKVVYCHTPARWLNVGDDYFVGRPGVLRSAFGAIRPALRRWDRRAAESAARYVANSHVVRERIRVAYGIDAEVVHPPVALDPAGTRDPVPGVSAPFLLTVARGRGYKNRAQVEEAAAILDRRLVVVGGSRTVSDAQLRELYASCDALVAAAYEDFGLTPIEAMAFGKPVVALRAGGYVESVVEGVTGVFFDRPEPEAIAAAVRRLDELSFDSDAIRRHAAAFSRERFAARMQAVVQEAVAG